MHRRDALRALIGAAIWTATLTHAAPAQEIYGSELMTEREREEHRRRMREAETEAERERIRAEHHEAMQARARERGATLPDAPPARRGHGDPGGGMRGNGPMAPRGGRGGDMMKPGGGGRSGGGGGRGGGKGG